MDDVKDIELHDEAMIRANGHFFNSASVVSKYVETFDLSKEYFMI